MEILWTMLKSMLKKVGFMTLAIPMLLLGTGAALAEDDENNYESKTKTVNYWCESIDNFEMPVTITASVPKKVGPNENFYIKDAYAFVTLPEDPAVNTLRSLFINTISGTVNKFEIHSETNNGTDDFDLAPISIPTTSVPSSGDLTFRVPGGTDTLTVESITAGSSGVVTITAGDIDTTINAHSILGPIPISASCSPIDDADNDVLVNIPIE